MPVNIVVPELGESIVEATVGRWLKKPGEPVHVGEPVVELETEKIDLEVGGDHSGVLARIDRQEGETVRIGDVLGVIEETSAGAEAPALVSAAPAASAPVKVPPKPEPPAHGGNHPEAPARATPLARRIAEEEGVDLTKVATSDTRGRVTKHDVEAYLESQARPPEPVQAATPAPMPAEIRKAPQPVPIRPAPAVEGPRREERVRLSRRRLTIARRLVEAQHAAAMLTTFNEIDMAAVAELRKSQKEAFKERHGVSLGITSFFVKAAVAALREFPRLNAEIQGEEMVLKHYYDIGVAVGASEGLVVPVLRDAERLSFAAIEIAIKEFARKAEEGKLTLEDLRGGTFTITNGGVFGSLMSTPILNPPQVGILGLHKIEARPVAVGGEVAVRPMMYVALSYDHRLVDGLEAVQFLVKVKSLVENPGLLLLEG